MSYTNIIDKSVSNKIILIEIDVGYRQGQWYNYTAGVWAYKWSKIRYDFAIGDGAIGDNPIGYGEYKNFIQVNSIFVGGEQLTERSSPDDLLSYEKSWYYDTDNYILYISLYHHYEPQLYAVTIGVTMGLSNKAVYLNNTYYEPRLVGLPVINKSKDIFYFGILKYEGGQLSFANNDGFFDNIMENYLFGQPVRVYHGGEGLSYNEFMLLYAGYIENVRLTYERFEIGVADNRKKLSVNIIQNHFNKTDYPYLDDDDIGKAIPVVYGEVYKCEVICVNKNQSGADWVFKVCDVSGHSNGIEDITGAYVENDSVSIKSKDLANGRFTIDNADWDGKKKVYCNVKGLKDSDGNYLTNPLDIIKDMLQVYASIEYNSNYYNTDEWEEARSNNLANDIGIFIGEDMPLSDVIEKICNSVFGNFIVQRDGRYTFRIVDESIEGYDTVEVKEMVEPFGVDWDGTQYLTKCLVGFKKNYKENNYRWYVKDDLEGDIYQKYKKKNSKEFETLLISETDAQELASAIMNYYKDVRMVVEVTVKERWMLVEIGDIIYIEVNRINKDMLGYIKAEVIGFSKDLMNNTVKLTCRYIETVTSFYMNDSPYAINVSGYAIIYDEYALTFGRRYYGT